MRFKFEVLRVSIVVAIYCYRMVLFGQLFLIAVAVVAAMDNISIVAVKCDKTEAIGNLAYVNSH